MKALPVSVAAVLSVVAADALAQAPVPTPPATKLKPITVSAEAQALTSTGIKAVRKEVKLTPGGVTLVEGDARYNRNISNLADLLRYVPGLFIASDSGGDALSFSSRGSNLDTIDYDMNGILLLKNGIPVSAADGTNHNLTVNPMTAQYAVVARGANGMKYGAATLGGAINFVSPTAYDLPGVVLFLNGGGHGQMQARVTVSKVFENGFDAVLTVERKTREGWRPQTEEDQFGVYGNLGWRISSTLETRLYLTYVDSEMELGGSISPKEFKNDNYKGDLAVKGNYQKNVDTLRLASKTTWQIGPHQKLDFGIAYETQTLYHPIVADPDNSIDGFFDGLLIDTNHENVAASFRYEQKIGAHNLLVGANYIVGGTEGKNYGNNHGKPGALTDLIDEEAQTLTVYLLDRWQVGEHWTVIPGVQYTYGGRELDNTHFTNTGPKRHSVHRTSTLNVAASYSDVNPRLGVIYHVAPSFDLYANISQLYEPPTNFVLVNTFTADPNDALEAMEGTSVEVGTRGSHEFGYNNRFQWDVSVYYSWLDNEILTVKDATPACGQLSCIFPTRNVDDTIHAGIEAMVSGHIGLDESGVHAIEPKLSLAINEFRFDDHPRWGNNTLPAAPRYVLKGEIMYHNAGGWYVGPTFDFVGERYAGYANDYTIDSYMLLGLRAGWSSEDVSLYVEAENVLDEAYVVTNKPVSDADKETPQLRPGAPFALYAGVKFEF